MNILNLLFSFHLFHSSLRLFNIPTNLMHPNKPTAPKPTTFQSDHSNGRRQDSSSKNQHRQVKWRVAGLFLQNPLFDRYQLKAWFAKSNFHLCSAVGWDLLHMIRLSWVRVEPKPNPTRPMDTLTLPKHSVRG